MTWKGADGWDIHAYPTGYASGARVPLALNVHGGPAAHILHPRSPRLGLAAVCPGRLAIFFPNPRGSGGYGETFRAANVRDLGVKDYEDIMKGINALVERGIADPDRLTVNGWSYGGFVDLDRQSRTGPLQVGDRRRRGHQPGVPFTGTADIPEFARSYFRSWPWTTRPPTSTTRRCSTPAT